jgi:hypothetical protein
VNADGFFGVRSDHGPTGNDAQLASTGVGVEKVDIRKNGVILGDSKCLGGPRKSFVGHSDAMEFGTSFRRRVFQQPQAKSLIEQKENLCRAPSIRDGERHVFIKTPGQDMRHFCVLGQLMLHS